MISEAYPLPSTLPQELQDKIHMTILDVEGTPSSRLIKDVLIGYHARYSGKKKREWNIYTYWGIQCFGRQCEMDSRNSHIYPLHIWCEVRLMMCTHGTGNLHPKVSLQEFYKLEELRRSLFKSRYEELFA